MASTLGAALFGKTPVQIITPPSASANEASVVVTLDAAITERHSKSVALTTNPVEQSFVTDHFVAEPETLSIEGIVSDTPIGILGAARGVAAGFQGLLDPSKKPSVEAFESLRRIQNEGLLCKVITTLHEYKSMSLSGFEVSRDAATGQALRCSLTFQEIIQAQTEELPNRDPVDASRANTDDAGVKPTSAAGAGDAAKAGEAAQASPSVTTQVADAAAGIFGG